MILKKIFPDTNGVNCLNVIILILIFYSSFFQMKGDKGVDVNVLLFIEASQFLSNILICGVEGSVNFLKVDKQTQD